MTKVIVHLARKLDSIRVPSARAIIIWMLGEYNSMGHIIPKVLPTVLKYLAWTFSSEAPETKLQILNAMVKVDNYKLLLLFLNEPLAQIFLDVNLHLS